jgi:hypothetical protein
MLDVRRKPAVPAFGVRFQFRQPLRRLRLDTRRFLFDTRKDA